LIVLEGIDSSGKMTQCKLLARKLRAARKRVVIINFPTYEKTRWGSIVSRYLKGEFGPKEKTPPEIGSMLYAMDRYQFKNKLFEMLAKGVFVLCDRYTQSNFFQVAKAPARERPRLVDWIYSLESLLPQPDALVLLDVSPDVSRKLLAGRKAKNHGVNGKDIHEKDLKYQREVRKVYLQQARKEGWVIVNCMSAKNGLRPREEISARVWSALKKKRIV
jgi:dTMP kinase